MPLDIPGRDGAEKLAQWPGLSRKAGMQAAYLYPRIFSMLCAVCSFA